MVSYRLQVNPHMPAHEGFTGQLVYREGWRMHEAFIGARDPEGREILLDPSAIVDQGVRVGRPVGVAMDEPFEAQVAEQPHFPGIVEVGGQRPLRVVLQDPGLSQGEGRQQGSAADQADRNQVVQRPASVEHDDQLPARAQDPVDLHLGLLDLRHVMQNAMAGYCGERVVRERQVEDAALPQLLIGEFP